MEFDKIKVLPDIGTLTLAKGKEIMSPEGVEETVILASQTVITLTQGGKYRVYLLGRCNHVHNMGIFTTEKDAVEHMGMVLGVEASMVLEPTMMREVILARLKRESK